MSKTQVSKKVYYYWDKNTDEITVAADRYDTYEELGRYTKNLMNKIVARDQIGPFLVSTVFLLFDHWGNWFETMIFEGESWVPLYSNRYRTSAEARENHTRVASQLLLDIETTPPSEIDWKKYEVNEI